MPWPNQNNTDLYGLPLANRINPPPTTSTDPGIRQQWALDDTFFYYCIGPNAWRRVTLSTYYEGVPTDFPGLRIWLSASTLALSDGASVSSWVDQSSNAYNFAQATGANQPTYKTNILNGQPVVRFDGTTDSLSATTTSPNGLTAATIITVTIPTATDSTTDMQKAIFDWQETGSWGNTGMKPLALRVNFRFGTSQTGNNNFYTRPTTKQGIGTITTAVHDTSTDFLYVDGILVAVNSGKSTTLSNNSTTCGIGISEAATLVDQDVAELVFYTSALPVEQRSAIERRFGRIYGITVPL